MLKILGKLRRDWPQLLLVAVVTLAGDYALL